MQRCQNKCISIIIFIFNTIPSIRRLVTQHLKTKSFSFPSYLKDIHENFYGCAEMSDNSAFIIEAVI